jgi:hypothetical protein
MFFMRHGLGHRLMLRGQQQRDSAYKRDQQIHRPSALHGRSWNRSRIKAKIVLRLERLQVVASLA